MSIIQYEFMPINNFKTVVDRLVQDLSPDDLLYKSTKGEKSKQYDLFKFINVDEDFTSVVNKIKEKTITYLHKNVNEYKVKDLSVASSWTVYGEEGSYHTIHRHDQGGPLVATVTYLKTPILDNSRKKTKGMFFYFFDNEVYHLEPTEGQIIIMPTWVLHGTYPQTKGLRQTLSVDFCVDFL